MLVFALIAITNLCIGYALAVWMGQGPRPWYAMFMPGKKTTGLIEIAPLEDAEPPPKRQQTDEEERVIISLEEISTEDLAKNAPPPKPRPVVDPRAEEEDETFATDLIAEDVANIIPEPPAVTVDEDVVESMRFDQLLGQTEPTSATEAADNQEDDAEVALSGSDIDALLAEAGKA